LIGGIKTNKKEKTRELILEKSQHLFAEIGFKQVTMKDICEATGLSRGGLYSHFSSTKEVFESLLEKITAEDEFDIGEEIKKGASAIDILNSSLKRMLKEIEQPEDSLSIAIYEYSQMNDPDEIVRLNKRAREKWSKLIRYGIERGEFNNVDVNEIVSLILYSYQGIRMWSRIIPMKKKVSDQIINHIRKQLIP
jgi:AcrR family transcriptional regulator